MLIDIITQRVDRGLDAVLSVIGRGSSGAVRIRKGCYQIGHFSFKEMLPGGYSYVFEGEECRNAWRSNPEIGDVPDGGWPPWSEYGVCDSPDQFFDHPIGQWIEASDRRFVVSFTKVSKADQPADGGWRWHKWGDYIGEKSPQYEYLYDEDDSIAEVYCFHIYEQVRQ